MDASVTRLLCCPESRQPLRPATAELLAKLESMRLAGRLRNRGGTQVEEVIEAGWCRADDEVFYPMRDDIPLLIVEEGIEMREGWDS